MAPTPQLHIPQSLLEGSKTWIASIRDLREWTPSEWRLIRLAAESYDRTQTARRILRQDGLVVRYPVMDKNGKQVGERISPHPATAIARDNTQLVSKLFAQLGLDKPAEAVVQEALSLDEELKRRMAGI